MPLNKETKPIRVLLNNSHNLTLIIYLHTYFVLFDPDQVLPLRV